MRPVTIYATPFCGYCMAARRLLAERGAVVEEIDLLAAPERRAEMIGRAKGARTVPQIFVGDEHLGGFSELWELDRSGGLDRILAGG